MASRFPNAEPKRYKSLRALFGAALGLLAVASTLSAQEMYGPPDPAWPYGPEMPVSSVGQVGWEAAAVVEPSQEFASRPMSEPAPGDATIWDVAGPPAPDPWARPEGFLEPAWRPDSLESGEWPDESWVEYTPASSKRTWQEARAATGWLYGDSVVDADRPSADYWWDGVARANYVNDQRWEFTGAEATFGVEGIVRGGGRRDVNGIQIDFGTELYLQQPFDRNYLIDSPDRIAYRGNFDIPPLEISQLAIRGSWQELSLTVGKFVTPFGRTDFPILTNGRWDGPFLRSQVVTYRETGALISWTPGPWRFDAAVTNGSEDRDTNSSKGLVARVGWEASGWAIGGSIKKQDGIGSEGQKYLQNHLGLDLSYRWGPWVFSSECIYDEYGFRRPGFAPGGIFWGRDLYHRDLHWAGGDRITGWGYYAGLGRVWQDRWTTWLSYGEFHPTPIGDVIHDHLNRRIEIKGIRHLGSGVDVFGAVMFENAVDELAWAGKPRPGNVILFGAEVGF